ncbi:MAG: hypothetical protein IJR02_15060 [Bacteroidaceae bacterium]|nr:hypothetical protein [Bacteroidaceae bacterium]MBQ6752065.1 hypothetical protein [Bacteroidaceae bacterium]
MKKSLLFLASMLVSAATFAQSFTAIWPQPKAPEFRDFAVEDTIYLWNVGAGGFYTNHRNGTAAPYYGTRACVNDTVGSKVIFTQNNPGGVDESANFTDAPNAYLLVSYVTKFSEFRCTFFTGWNAIWTDNNTESNRYFNIVKNGNYIKIDPNSEINASGVEGQYLGIRETDADKVVFLYDTDTEGAIGAEETFYSDWAAVSKEVYDEYYVYINSEETKDMIARYAAAQTLKANILGAESKGITSANLANEYAVYNNLNSTVEELKAAAAAAYDKGRWVEIEEYFKDVVQGEKNDVSGVFVNNDFSAGNVDGWDITYQGGSKEATNIGYQYSAGTYDITIPETGEVVMGYMNGEAWISGFIEAWKDTNTPNYLGDGSITQTIPGLPAGRYTLGVDVIASNQGRVKDADNPNNYPDDVELFATASLDGKTYKTNMYTRDGKPEHFEFTFIHTGGSMTLGLRVVNSAEAKMPANWIAMDNLKLYYYGEVAEDPEKALLDAKVEELIAKYNPENLDDIYASTESKQAYKQAIDDAQNAVDNYAALQVAVETAFSDLDASVTAYAAYQKEVLYIRDYMSSHELDGEKESVQILGDYVMEGSVEEPNEDMPNGSAEYILENGSLSTEQIIAETTRIQDALQTAIVESLYEGKDCTDMLVNPSFAEGFTGWTNAGGVTGGLKEQPIVECYYDSHGKVDCYQIVKNVPDGIYAISCQAFERPGGNTQFTGDEEPKVFLYMNDFQTPVMNICKDAMPADQAEDKVNCYKGPESGAWPYDYMVDEFGWIPNSVDGGSYAFLADSYYFPGTKRYTNTAYGLVEGGTMKIGLTSNGQKHHWVLWANFKLTYEGKSEKALQAILPTFIESLQNYVEANEENMTKPVSDKAEQIIAEAEDARTADEMYESLIAINKFMSEAKANVAAVTEFMETNDKLIAAVEAEDANPDGIDAYNTISNEIDSYNNLTTEEVIALTDKMKSVISLLNIPADWQNASDSNPVDFTKLIVNSTFDTIGDFTGWSDGFGAGGTTSTNAECFSKNFDVYQDIAGLPAGTYKVGVQGYYRQGEAANDYNNTQTEEGTPAYNAVIYATGENGETSSNPIMSICAVLLENGLGGSTVTVGGSYVVPNSMEAATYWFDATDEEGNSMGYYAPNDQFNFAVVKVGEDGKLRIGVKKDVTITNDWAIFDNFTLTYYGKDSLTAISEVEKSAISSAATGIYTVAGARVDTLKKGINIIKMADGSVRKVYVK